MTQSAHIAGLGYSSKTFTILDENSAARIPTVQVR